MPQSVTFHGAARTVTGSRHLLELDGRKTLVDCGLFQGGAELASLNRQDHIGYLPVLHRNGYGGAVYATPATIALAKISLPDSGRIHEEDARYAAKKGRPGDGPLYTEAEAYAALKLLQPVRYFEHRALPGGAVFRYLPAGHVLGSAFAEVYFENGERILMGGDLGRPGRPILKDPHTVEFAEYLVLESTYGDRLHDQTDPAEALESVIREAVRLRGCVLVPSFAIGRTQELLWHIGRLHKQGRIPRIPIYVDSPMATSVTKVYTDQTEDHDIEMREASRDGRDPLGGEAVRIVRDRSMSRALNDMRGPMMVISGSGMVTGGRILHHLLNRLSDEATTVLFTGYQAVGTPGRALLEGADEIRILGTEVPVRASIRVLDGLSAHADQAETLAWLRGFREPPRRTFLVHGDPGPQDALAAKIRSDLGWEVAIPSRGETFEL
jgi:metallo-beta-lactamase family protein